MKLKSLILSFAIMLFAVSGLLAQDKYEYAKIRPNEYGNAVLFVTSDKEESTPSSNKDLEKDLLKKLNELGLQGWEVYNTQEASGRYVNTYFIRKKKN